MNQLPLISVIMPVYNTEQFLEDTMNSILKQTLSDFELIIINDGSTDNSKTIIHSYSDLRIRVINFDKNKGCYPSRNAGMRIARGKYICVMDSDDICMLDRLEKQYCFLEEQPEFGLIGSAFKYFNSSIPFYRETDYEIIKLMSLKFCYILHPTCMVRNSLIKKYNLFYDEYFRYASDYDWQVKALSLFPVTNLNEILLHYRQHPEQISIKKASTQWKYADEVRVKQLRNIGLNIKKDKQNVILDFLKGILIEKAHLATIHMFIDQILLLNSASNYYSQKKLEEILNRLWTRQEELRNQGINEHNYHNTSQYEK